MLESGFPSNTFSGVRFGLVGFNPIAENTLRSKLLSGGGVDVGQYSQTCTHLIVDKLVYDDPICVAARSSGKVVVTGSWVDHSFDIGMLINANSVLYRPLRDLNGIPEAKSLVVCLTGYQRQDREDIMTMVDLMGGEFSKPLVANKVTHLICYKFEGEKYELAKRMKRIKLVNHRWLEDCLKKWKLLPEVDYEISGYELEMMEASAKDSEDEAENASVKPKKNSPLGLRVGAMAAVTMSKPGTNNISVVQANSGAQEGSSFCDTSKDNWLTPNKTDRPSEAMVSSNAGAAQEHNFQRARTSLGTSNYVSPIRVANKTPEQGMSKMETDGSTSINTSTRRPSSLATYSRKTLQRSIETDTLGKESSGQNRSLRTDEKDLKASTAFNISSSKFGFSAERTTLFEDLDKIDKLLGKESPPLMPQAKFTDGSVRDKSSQEVQQNCEPSILAQASLLLQESRPSLPNENLRPVTSINDPAGSGEVGHKSPASVLKTKLLSSNVVPMKDVISAAENIISKCAWDEIEEKSLTEPIAGNILLQEPRSGLPKQNLRLVPNLGDHTENREAVYNLDMSDSAARLFHSGVVPMEADNWDPENSTRKGALDEVPERSVTDHVMRRLSTSPGASLTEMKDEDETVLLKKKTAPRKSLGTRGRKKNTINQKGSIYLREPSPKDERVDCLKKAKVSTPATNNGNLKEISCPVQNTEALPDTAKHIISETEALKSDASKDKDNLLLDLTVKEDDLRAKTPEEAEAEVETRMLEPKLNDVLAKDPSDDAVQFEVDKNKSKRKREATDDKSRLQSGKKDSSSKAETGKCNVKKTKKSRKEHDSNVNDTVMKDKGDNSAVEKENIASGNITGRVSSAGDQSPVAGEALASKDAATKNPNNAATKNPNNAAVELQVNKIKRKIRTEVTAEKITLQSGEGCSVSVEVGKSCEKKTRKSKKERGVNATNAMMETIGDNTPEEKENKSRKVGSDGDEIPVSRKPLAKKEVAKSAKTGSKAGKDTKQLNVKPLASRKVSRDQEHEPKFFIVSGPRPQRKEYQQIIRRLKGKCCRDSHQWSYQATHFIASEIRRTEKFFAAAASGSWILKTDYVADSKEAGKLLEEELYEWHSTGLSADGTINLESPRKWRLVREQTGHGALYGLRIVVYGDCTIPSLDTLKRAVKAGDGTILATAPPYTRFLNRDTDFALISPGMPRDDHWIQEFISHEIPCVLSDYLVEYVCKPGYGLDKHVLYNTNSWAERSFNKLQLNADAYSS